MGVLQVIFGILVTFVVVVLVHELGHYFAARLVGVKARECALGFGRVLLSKTMPSGCVFQLRILPLGGYVKFVGDENATSFGLDTTGPVEPGSLRSVSLGKRAFVVAAGPAINLVLAVLLFAVVAVGQGRPVTPWEVAMSHLPQFEPGDSVHAIGGQDTATLASLDDLTKSDIAQHVNYAITRDGVDETPTAGPLTVPVVGLVAPGSPADQAGIKVGDIVWRVTDEDRHLLTWSDLTDVVANTDGPVSFDLLRYDGIQTHLHQVSLTPDVSSGSPRIGVGQMPAVTLVYRTPSLIEAVGSGLSRTSEFVSIASAGLAATLIGQGELCKLHGPVRIASLAGQTVQLGWLVFLQFVAVISASLALMNLLPIPGLDGGHLLTYGIEKALGRTPSKRVQAGLFVFGMTGVVYLMLSALIADLIC